MCNQECIAFNQQAADSAESEPWDVCVPLNSLVTIASVVRRVGNRIDTAIQDYTRTSFPSPPRGL